MKFSVKIILSLMLVVWLALGCEDSKDNTKVSFGVNTHIIDCVATAEVFIDGVSVGTIPGYCDAITDCESSNTLNKDVEAGEHTYKIEVKGVDGGCYRVEEGSFEINNNECVKIFMDLSLRKE